MKLQQEEAAKQSKALRTGEGFQLNRATHSIQDLLTSPSPSQQQGQRHHEGKAEAAALNGDCKPTKVRNSLHFKDVTTDHEEGVTSKTEQTSDGVSSPPQVPDTGGDQQTFVSAEFSSSSLHSGEAKKDAPFNDGNKGGKHSIADEAKVFKISLAKKDLPHQQYINVPIIVNCIAVRLRIAPEAAR
eukprot:2390645-Pleurochrysis_carterae.AAC.1